MDELFLPGKVESGCFWKWHGSWWKEYQATKKIATDHENPPTILWLSFEEFKTDPLSFV
jgi:hypothetical protein